MYCMEAFRSPIYIRSSDVCILPKVLTICLIYGSLRMIIMLWHCVLHVLIKCVYLLYGSMEDKIDWKGYIRNLNMGRQSLAVSFILFSFQPIYTSLLLCRRFVEC